MGMLKRPRFHGPGLNLLPTKNTRIKIGVVNATKAARAPILKIQKSREGLDVDVDTMASRGAIGSLGVLKATVDVSQYMKRSGRSQGRTIPFIIELLQDVSMLCKPA